MSVTIPEQRYGPNTGAVTGWIGLATCVALDVGLLMNPETVNVRFALIFAVVGLVIWCYQVRPRIIIREPESTLVLRNAFSSWFVPLAAITAVRVKAYTRVDVGEEGYDGIAMGRRVRVMLRGPRPPRRDRYPEAGFGLGDSSYKEVKRAASNTPEAVADLMVEQILAASDRAKETGRPIGPVVRTWAWVELALLAGMLVGLVVTFLA